MVEANKFTIEEVIHWQGEIKDKSKCSHSVGINLDSRPINSSTTQIMSINYNNRYPIIKSDWVLYYASFESWVLYDTT